MAKPVPTIEQWVCELNRMARQMDDEANSLHPEVAFNQSEKQRAEFRKLAANPPKEAP